MKIRHECEENSMFDNLPKTVNTADYPYKIELHAHTKPQSPCSDIPPAELVRIYFEHGYDAIAITNHFTCNMDYGLGSAEKNIELYLKGYNEAFAEGQRLGINVIFGAELCFSENSNDYLIYGFEPDQLPEIYASLNNGIDRFYREFKRPDNVILQAHPFRDGLVRKTFRCIDGIESFNLHPNHNARPGLAAKYAHENGLIAVAGTDAHHSGQLCLSALAAKTLPANTKELAQIILSQDYLMWVEGNYIIRV